MGQAELRLHAPVRPKSLARLLPRPRHRCLLPGRRREGQRPGRARSSPGNRRRL